MIILYIIIISVVPPVFPDPCQGPGCEPALLLCLKLYFKNGLLAHPFFNWLLVEPQYVIPSTLFETPHHKHGKNWGMTIPNGGLFLAIHSP